MITPTQFKERFPEFDSIDDSRVLTFLNKASLLVSECKWGNLYDEGVALLAAHYLALSILQESASSATPSFPVSSKKVGDVQINYGVPSADSGTEAYYLRTPYGAEYWSLVRLVGMGAVAVSELQTGC